MADFQARALLHVERADPALPVQRVALAVDGQPCAWHRAPDAPPRVLRLFSYLPGLRCRTPRVRRRSATTLARTLARLGLALRGFEHEAGALALPWDIQRADEVAPLLAHVADPARRALAERHGALHRACPAGAARLAGAGHPQ